MTGFKALQASSVRARGLFLSLLLGCIAVAVAVSAALPARAAAAFDVTPPLPPVIGQPVDGVLIGPGVTFVGTAEPDSTVLVFLDGSIITAFADGAGIWTTASTPVVATDGVHSAYAMAFDSAGNISDPSPTTTFTVDAVAPAAPVITAPLDSSATDDGTPTISGTAEAGSTVQLAIDGGAPVTLAASAGGAWSYTPASDLSVGAHTLVAVAVDGVGNRSPASTTVRFTYSRVTFVTASLPAGQVGASYAAAIVVTGGTGPYSLIETVSGLPGGVTMSQTGAITGTPLASGSFAFTVRATDSNGVWATQAYTIVVAPPAPPSAGARAVQIPATSANGPTTINLSGVVANAAAIEIVSPPTRGSLTISGLSVIYEPVAGFFGDDAFTYRAVGFADGGPAAVSAPATVTITLSPPTLVLTGGVQPNGRIGVGYSRTLAASGGTAPYAYALTAGVLPAGVTLTTDGTLSGTPTAGGVFNFTVTATDRSIGVGPFSVSAAHVLTIDAPAMVVTPATLPDAVVAQAYNQAFGVTGGVAPYTYAVTGGGLPAGMSLSPAGVLSGTPTAGGAFRFVVSVRDASTGAGSYTVNHPVALTVSGSAIAISPASLPAAKRGSAYSQTVTASGGVAPYTYEIVSGVLPAGLTLATTGQISGAPTVTGSFTFQVRGTDSAGGSGPYSGTTSLTLTVEAASLTVTPAVLPEVFAGAAFSQQMQATGGQGGYSFAVTTGTLPQGVTLTTAGVLSGRSSAAGSFGFTITATDGFGNTGAAALMLKVAGRPDPGADPDVRGLNTAQAEATRRLAGTQMTNFSRRLEMLHDGAGGRRTVALDLSLDAGAFTPLDENRRTMGELGQVPGRSHGAGLTGVRDLSEREELARMMAASRVDGTHGAVPGVSQRGRLSAGPGGSSDGPSSGPAIWAGGAISLGERDATTQTAELSVTTSGISAGVDFSINDTLDLGLGAGFGQEDTDVGMDVSRMEAKSWVGVAYGSWRPRETLFVDGMLGYGQLSFDLRRRAAVNGDAVFGERDGTLWFGALAAGADRRFGPARVLGYGRLEAVEAELDAFTETGSALWALRYEARDVSSLQGTMGLRYEREIRRGHDRWIPGGRLELRHEFADTDVQGLRYADWLDGPGYSIGQEGWGRTQLKLGLSLGFEGRAGLSWSGEYEGGFSDDETLSSFRIRLAKQF